jgi:hypothetical protein
MATSGSYESVLSLGALTLTQCSTSNLLLGCAQASNLSQKLERCATRIIPHCLSSNIKLRRLNVEKQAGEDHVSEHDPPAKVESFLKSKQLSLFFSSLEFRNITTFLSCSMDFSGHCGIESANQPIVRVGICT